MQKKQKLLSDWEQVGEDMRVAMGMTERHIDVKAFRINSMRAFLNGILSINPFGLTNITTKMLSIYKTNRVKQR